MEGQRDVPDWAEFAIDSDRAANPTDLSDGAPLGDKPPSIDPKEAVGVLSRGCDLWATDDAVVASYDEGDSTGGCHLRAAIRQNG
jgi:hypothetical protein